MLPIPQDEEIDLRAMRIEAGVVTEEGHRLELLYLSTWDYSFVNAPAWEVCAGMQFAMATIIGAMSAHAKQAAVARAQRQ